MRNVSTCARANKLFGAGAKKRGKQVSDSAGGAIAIDSRGESRRKLFKAGTGSLRYAGT
jgi:hypothetical protein